MEVYLVVFGFDGHDCPSEDIVKCFFSKKEANNYANRYGKLLRVLRKHLCVIRYIYDINSNKIQYSCLRNLRFPDSIEITPIEVI